jgi:glycosyltransferase involved in cell wall biosynthesis
VDPARTSVIQNGTELVDLLARNQLRAFQAGTRTDGALRVAFVGSFEPWQGLPLLLTAVAEAVERGANVTLGLAGSGREEARLRAMARDLALGDRVTFKGHLALPELAAFLSQCDVGVSLYQRRPEFTGLKLLDYKAAGLATIAVGQGGEPSLLAHRQTGLIIPPNDRSAAGEALRQLAADVDLVARMGQLARREAESAHRWAHTAQALDRLFVRLTATKRSATLPATRAADSAANGREGQSIDAHRPV